MMSDDGIPSIPPSIRGLIQDPSPNPTTPNPNSNPSKRKRSLPGTPDPDAEVIALSPESLMAKNRFICEICNKGFQRDQNLQLHRRGHNLPWKLKQRNNNEVRKKKVYICPEKTCVHHHPSRALGDLTGVKKHYSRKHGEKKWKCSKCSKKYAVLSDLKAHTKVCGTREYKCDCGTLFSRKDSYITHRAFCDAFAGEKEGFTTANLSFRNEIMNVGFNNLENGGNSNFSGVFRQEIGGLESGSGLPIWLESANSQPGPIGNPIQIANTQNYDQWMNVSSSSALPRGVLKGGEENKGSLSEGGITSSLYYTNNIMNHQDETNDAAAAAAVLSATALLQQAAQIGSTRSRDSAVFGLMGSSFSTTVGFNKNEGENNLNGFMTSASASTLSSNNGDHNNLMVDGTNSNSVVMNIKNEGHDNSLTRDFLGVGADENRHYLQEFASMSSDMEMSHYMTRNH